MKIAFYTTSFFPYICGVSTVVLNFSLGLRKRGHEIILCVPKARSPVFSKLRKMGIKIVFSPAFKTKIYKDKSHRVGAPSPKVFLEIKKLNPDIIHFQTPAFVDWEAVLTAKLLKKPLIGHFHTYYMSPEMQKVVKQTKKGEEIIEKLLWQYTKSIYNRCDLVLTASRYAKKDLEKHGLKKPIKLLPNPIDLKSLKRVSIRRVEDLKKKYRLGEKTALYVGRLSKEKSIEVLLFAFNLVLRKIPKAKLILVGEGPIKKELEKLGKDLGLEENLVFLGKVDYDQLLKSGLYEVSSLFATASSSEVQPLSVLEAMGKGLVIVGVRARGVIELVKNNGILCQPNNPQDFSQAMIKILENKELRRKFSQESRKIIKQKHEINKVCQKLEEIYKELLN